MKKENIIHEYFKKELDGMKILVQVDMKGLKGVELIVYPDGEIEKTEREFDEEIKEDFAHDGFEPASPLEFNLYLKGLVRNDD